MSNLNLVELLLYAEPLLCAGGLVLVHRSKQWRQYIFLAAYLLVRIVSFSALMSFPSVFHSLGHPLSPRSVYTIYFYGYWASYAIEAVLGFGIIFSVYNLAMAPLKGLQKLGMLMFRWAGGIAIAVAFTVALGPSMSSHSFIIAAVSKLQQTQSVLTLCMLLFVCMAIRPMGLSYRSKIFGVSLGLGVLAAADLVGAAWLSHFKDLASLYNTFNGAAMLVAFGMWMTYFAIPEPKRRMIILPTTSPFLRWNQISLALGDEPGFVAVGEISPDMFAPAEVEVMRRASEKMRRMAI